MNKRRRFKAKARRKLHRHIDEVMHRSIMRAYYRTRDLFFDKLDSKLVKELQTRFKDMTWDRQEL